jgi:hypothetical protein
MNIIKNGTLQERTAQGGKMRVAGLALGAGVCAFLLAALPATAGAGTPMTQLEYIRWVAQLSGASAQFTAKSGVSDYVQWARDNGMNPSGGWNVSAALTREVLAQTLAQLYGISATKGNTDWVRLLQREGIEISGAPIVSRSDLAGVIDGGGLQGLTGQRAIVKKTLVNAPGLEKKGAYVIPGQGRVPSPGQGHGSAPLRVK